MTCRYIDTQYKLYYKYPVCHKYADISMWFDFKMQKNELKSFSNLMKIFNVFVPSRKSHSDTYSEKKVMKESKLNI